MDTRNDTPQKTGPMQERRIPLGTKPSVINVGDKPPLLGGTIKEMPVDQFAKEAGFEEWCEDMVLGNDEVGSLLKQVAPSKELPSNALREMEGNRDKWAICYVNEIVKYGVFAIKDIPDRAWIAPYSGDVLISSQDTISPYFVDFPNDENPEGQPIGVDAKKHRNVAGFFQDLPDSASEQNDDFINITDYIFDQGNSGSVALANLKIGVYKYNGFSMLACRAIGNIKAGAQLGWGYSKPYWLGFEVAPLLFDTMGNIFDSTQYRTEKILLRVIAKGTNQSIEVEITKEELEYRLQKAPIKLEAPKCVKLSVTQEDYQSALDKYPRSPFVIVKASSVTFFDSSQQKKYVVCSSLNELTLSSDNKDDFNRSWKYDTGKKIASFEGSEEEVSKVKLNLAKNDLLKDVKTKTEVLKGSTKLVIQLHDTLLKALDKAREEKKSTLGFTKGVKRKFQ